ncbi:MAG: SAM-dependent methyltransferase, partial [Dehalococcoidia bacterium]
MTITVVGLGPGDPGLLTVTARELLTGAMPVLFRTTRHPTTTALSLSEPLQSFDDLYETADTFDAVYDAIVARLIELGTAGDIVYAVPGDPLVGEATVPVLRARAREGSGPPVRIVHGVSFLEPVCAALDLDPLAAGLQLVDAIEPRLDPTRPAIIAQVYARHAATGLKLALLELYPPEHAVTVIRAAGLPEQHIEALLLEAIDRRDDLFDHLACLYIPALVPEANLRSFDGLRAISH